MNVADNSQTSRRRVLHTIGIGTTVAIAGCSGGGDEGSDTPEEQTDTPEEQTDTPESTSVFADYAVEGTELSVELTEKSLGEISQIRIETPSGEKTIEVSSTITEYSIDVLRDRAGTWFIDALDNGGEIIETAELEATFDVSVSDIGTLSQLEVTGKSSAFEEVSFQLTVTNTGNVPVEPLEIETVVPEFDSIVATNTIGTGNSMNTYDEGTYGGVVDRDGNTIIPSGSQNIYRYKSLTSRSVILVFDEERANEVAGQSFQGEFIIRYQAERDNTSIPINIQLGTNVITDSDFTTEAYIEGTVIEER